MKISNKKMVIHAEIIDYNFLKRNNSLKEFEAPNLKSVLAWFLRWNESLENLDAPNLEKFGSWSLQYNRNIDKSKYR